MLRDSDCSAPAQNNVYSAWPGGNSVEERCAKGDFGLRIWLSSKVGSALYTNVVRQRLLCPTRGNWKANRADSPAALELRMELCGKQTKSTSKAGARFLRWLTAWDNEVLRDSDCSAPAHNNVYSAWPGEELC